MGTVLAAVGIAAVWVSHRVLDASDTDSARGRAQSACEVLAHERKEGDSHEEALAEVTEVGRGPLACK